MLRNVETMIKYDFYYFYLMFKKSVDIENPDSSLDRNGYAHVDGG